MGKNRHAVPLVTHIHFEGEVNGDGQQEISPDHLIIFGKASIPTVSLLNKEGRHLNDVVITIMKTNISD